MTVVGTANDTSATYHIGDIPWESIWIRVIPDIVGAGGDSIDVYVIMQAYPNPLDVGSDPTQGIAWERIDSVLLATADTLDGSHKDFSAKVPPATQRLRFIVDGVTGNDASGGTKSKIWLYLKQ
jgi:hypothetical protein